MDEVRALEAQCEDLGSLLSELGPDDWSRPTRCPPMTVRELVGHVGRVLHRFGEALQQGDAGPVNCDRVAYWRYDPAATGQRVVDEATKYSSDKTDGELLAWWREGAELAVGAARTTAADRPVRRGEFVLTALEFAATRVVETGVHGMDIGHATLRGERIHPAAVPVITGVLDGLLGSRLPPSIGWAGGTYILTGTGRRPLSSIERHTLGPLAERFPLIS